MKKIVAICLAIVMLLGTVLCLASCGETNVTIKGITREELDAAVAASAVDVDALKADILAEVPEAESVDVDAIIAAVLAALEPVEETEVSINGITIVKGDYSVERIETEVYFAVRYYTLVANPEYNAEDEDSEEFIRGEQVAETVFAVPYVYDVLYYFGAPYGYAPKCPEVIVIDIEGNYAVVEETIYTIVEGKVDAELDTTIFPANAADYVADYEYCIFDFDAVALVD